MADYPVTYIPSSGVAPQQKQQNPLLPPDFEAPQTPATYIPSYQAQPEQPVQPWMGFGGSTAGIAHIAGNFLNGWMSGKNLAEQRKRQNAQQEISSTFSLWKQGRESGQNLANQIGALQAKYQGKPVEQWDNPADQQSFKVLQDAFSTVQSALPSLARNVADVFGKYSPQPKGAKGAKGARAQSAQGEEQPHPLEALVPHAMAAFTEHGGSLPVQLPNAQGGNTAVPAAAFAPPPAVPNAQPAVANLPTAAQGGAPGGGSAAVTGATTGPVRVPGGDNVASPAQPGAMSSIAGRLTGALGKVGGGLNHAFLPQSPQFFKEGTGTNWAAAVGGTPIVADQSYIANALAQQAQAKQAGNMANLSGVQLDLAKLDQKQREGVLDARQQFYNLYDAYGTLKQHDPNDPYLKTIDDRLHSLKAMLGGYDVKAFTPAEMDTEEGRHQLENAVNQAKIRAIENLRSGAPLSYQDAMLLGMQPKDILDVYLQNVGPDKRFKDTFQAGQQMVADQRSMYGARFAATPTGALYDSIQREHANDPNWTPQDTEYEFQRRVRGSAAERNELSGIATTAGGRARSAAGASGAFNPKEMELQRAQALRATVIAHPEFKDVLVATEGDKGKQYDIRDPKSTHMLWPDSGILGVWDTEGFNKRRGEAIKAVRQTAARMFGEVAPDAMFGPEAESAPQGSPSVANQGSQSTAPKRYKVTDGKGKSVEKTIPANEAAFLAQRGLKVEEIGPSAAAPKSGVSQPRGGHR